MLTVLQCDSTIKNTNGNSDAHATNPGRLCVLTSFNGDRRKASTCCKGLGQN